MDARGIGENVSTPVLSEHVRGKGRMYRHPALDELVPSVTNVIGMLDKPALSRWSALEVAKGAYKMRHALTEMDEAEAVGILKQLPWSKADRAADRGTDIHEWLEAALLGRELPPLADEAQKYWPAAQGWLDWFDGTVLATEQTFFHDDYAGTADLVCDVGGERWLVDFKTSKGLYESVALQLSALAYAHMLPDGTDNWTYTRLVAVRIGEDGWEMADVTDPEGSFGAFLGLLDVWRWKHAGKPLGKVQP
jgi:hypothetical protein